MKNQTRIDNHLMDLQLFAGLDDEAMQASLMDMFNAPGEADPNSATPSESPSAVEVPEGAIVIKEGDQGTPPIEGTQVPGTPPVAPASEQPAPGSQTPAMIGGQFKSVDDLLKSYKESQAMGTRKAQEAAQYKAMAEKLQLQATQNVDPVQQTSQTTEVPGEVDPLTDSEALTELLYSDPAKVIQMILDRTKQQTDSSLAPITQERDERARQDDWRGRVDEFQSTHPDTEKWSTDMSQILKENPQLREQENGLEIAYNAARGQKYSAPQEIDPKSFLTDQNFVKDNILNNEDINKQIIQQYLAKLQNGGAPMTIGQAPVGGSTALTPPKRATTMEEAEEMAMSMFQK